MKKYRKSAIVAVMAIALVTLVTPSVISAQGGCHPNTAPFTGYRYVSQVDGSMQSYAVWTTISIFEMQTYRDETSPTHPNYPHYILNGCGEYVSVPAQGQPCAQVCSTMREVWICAPAPYGWVLNVPQNLAAHGCGLQDQAVVVTATPQPGMTVLAVGEQQPPPIPLTATPVPPPAPEPQRKVDENSNPLRALLGVGLLFAFAAVVAAFILRRRAQADEIEVPEDEPVDPVTHEAELEGDQGEFEEPEPYSSADIAFADEYLDEIEGSE